ncbi:ABC transporter ATP-binding protein [Halorussus litoreus]|uniref:ABC transporter ATP-binding protein n=1 Tax=Halorussus litoreus TaxID=1710536 RepID=UPI000E2657A6|nr:ABC transporter ATP-binding protein [Halorussus litoreus]
MAAIETNGLTKVFGDSVVAVEDLDLEVEQGEVYGFLGHNGAGKSTTIDILLDFLHPTDGSASVLGHDTREESLAIRERVGVLPEGAKLYDRLTGREHIEFAMEIKGVDGDPDDIFERVGLDRDDADRTVGEYSKGMCQRLGLGMALVGDPDLLILDEPSSGLDPTGMSEMRDLIREEADDGTAVFFSSHLLTEVEAVCDRIGILSDGKLVAQDSIEVLRERFGGEATIEVTVDAVPDDGFDLETVDGVLGSTVDPEEDTVVVECEDSTVRGDVVQRVGEAATIIDIVSEEASLESMFEEYVRNGTGEELAGGDLDSESADGSTKSEESASSNGSETEVAR